MISQSKLAPNRPAPSCQRRIVMYPLQDMLPNLDPADRASGLLEADHYPFFKATAATRLTHVRKIAHLPPDYSRFTFAHYIDSDLGMMNAGKTCFHREKSDKKVGNHFSID